MGTLIALFSLIVAANLIHGNPNEKIIADRLTVEEINPGLSKLEYESRGLALNDRCDAFVAYLQQVVKDAPTGRGQLLRASIEALESRSAKRINRPLALSVLKECLLLNSNNELQVGQPKVAESIDDLKTDNYKRVQDEAIELGQRAAEFEKLSRDKAQLNVALGECQQNKVDLNNALATANQERVRHEDQLKMLIGRLEKSFLQEGIVKHFHGLADIEADLNRLRIERSDCEVALKKAESILNEGTSTIDELMFALDNKRQEAKLEHNRQKVLTNDLQLKLDSTERKLEKMRETVAAREAELAQVRATMERQEVLTKSRSAEFERIRREIEDERKNQNSKEIKVEFVRGENQPWDYLQNQNQYSYAPRFRYYSR